MDSISDRVKQAEAAEQKGDFFTAAVYYKEAVKIARNTSDSASLPALKEKLKVANKKALENFNQASLETSIPNAQIEELVSKVMEAGDLYECLERVGKLSTFQPKVGEIRELSKNNEPLLTQLATHSTISADGHLVKGGEDASESWFFLMYGLRHDLGFLPFLKPVLMKLKEEKGLDSKSITDYLRTRGTFEEEDLFFLEKGFERFFAGDYVSSLHILVPRIESVFWDMSRKLGIDTISLNRTQEISTQNRTLSDKHLRSLAFKQAWGEDLSFHLSYTFFEPLGKQLRHKVAHGLLSPEESDENSVNVAIYFILVFAARLRKRT